MYILIALVLLARFLRLSFTTASSPCVRPGKNAFADIDVQLKQRHDLVPNLVETVKGYAAHEAGVFEKVTEARASAMRAATPGEKGAAEGQLSGALANFDGGCRKLSAIEGRRQFPPVAGPAHRSRKQDRRRAPLLQQFGGRIQCRASNSFLGRALCRTFRLHACRNVCARCDRKNRSQRAAECVVRQLSGSPFSRGKTLCQRRSAFPPYRWNNNIKSMLLLLMFPFLLLGLMGGVFYLFGLGQCEPAGLRRRSQ